MRGRREVDDDADFAGVDAGADSGGSSGADGGGRTVGVGVRRRRAEDRETLVPFFDQP